MKNSNNQYEILTNVVFHGGSVEKFSDTELIQDVTFHGGSVEKFNDTELIQDVTFHGGSEEQVEDTELIQDVTFHGGSEECVEDTELIQDVTFHYLVWACQNMRCEATFASRHNQVCPRCGSKLEAVASMAGAEYL